MKYKGNRWFKCDFHLHTTASKCFQDETVTAKQWVEKAIAVGLDCVAVTDHNTGAGITAIQEAAKDTDLIVFPGVEITCDTSKIHLLVLFDIEKSSQDIEDFLISCDIKRSDFGEQDASTTKTIFDIVEIAKKAEALVIPAHIDEYNGINNASHDNLEKFYELNDINAVHVVHKEFLECKIDGNLLKENLNAHYGKFIDDSTIKEWRKPVTLALKYKKSILTFSDNPHEEKSPKHGLCGIGRRYTWIKMEEQPNLESLRQAFLLPDFRVKNYFQSESRPYKTPELWIKSIKVANTLITEKDIPLFTEFSPQLNTIIGGRGSGKSSILRFIRGVFNKTHDLKELVDIEKDHLNFYKKPDKKNKSGVISDDSNIEIIFIRENKTYKFTATNITSSDGQHISIEKCEEETGQSIIINSEKFIDFFDFKHYSQKQIYEIATKPNSLREIIDDAISDINILKAKVEECKTALKNNAIKIRQAEQQIAGKSKLETEIYDLTERIKAYQKSSLAEIMQVKKVFSDDEKIIQKFIDALKSQQIEINNFCISFPDFSTSEFSNNHIEEIKKYNDEAISNLKDIHSKLENLKKDSLKITTDYENKIKNSQWNYEFKETLKNFEEIKEKLPNSVIEDIDKIEALTKNKEEKEEDLKKILKLEINLSALYVEKNDLKNKYIASLKNITQKRQEFVSSILKNENVKINIKPFRSKISFEEQLRKILNRDREFQSDIDHLAEICFSGNVENKIQEVKSKLVEIRKGKEVKDISANFCKVLNLLADNQLDEIEILMPEDEIEVQYKSSDNSSFKSLSTASAGQKTTAILTFMLSYGEIPLILDQPEDDLDNRLVYELVVERLKNAKNKRQLIIVTHNANIPVNADSEYIISMDSNSEKLRISATGSADSINVKQEICAVMEGGETAFKMRAERYKLI